MKHPPSLRITSFRLRIALLSVAVSGAVLLVFGTLTFAAVQRIAIGRMDRDIRESIHRPLTMPRGPEQWERVSDSLRFFFGGEEEDTFILLVKNRNDSILYASSNWPDDLSTGAFPPPDEWGDYPHLEAPSRSDRPGPPPERRGDVAGFQEQPGEGGPRGRPDGPHGGMGPPPIPLKAPEFSTHRTGGTEWRIGMMGSPEVTVVLGLNTQRVTTEMAQVRNALLMIFPVALMFVALGAWWMSHRALKPIESVTGAIERVKAEGLDQRVDGADTDREFAKLVTVFNDMMEWLEASFDQAIRFSADASHELKTPLTVLQAQLERAVSEAEPGSDEQRRYEALAKELQRLKSITRKLLILSRIDAGELKLNLRPLNLSELVEAIAEDSEILAPKLTVETDLAPDQHVNADADLMKQVVQNLAANAMKYNTKGGFVRFVLHPDGGDVRLTIANTGRGIPPEDRDNVFTRFYRGDKSRGRRVSGAGLGLSLAREIVRAHHGDLVLAETHDGTTAFSMNLPSV
ncbi:MAG: HAMP domain-containing protein [bacterium]|nr:HAMP domain-containing protein [bacterium]